MTLFDSFEPDVPRLAGDLHTASGLARLLALPGIGPKRAVVLANTFHEWSALASASEDDLIPLGRTLAKSLVSAISTSSIPRMPEPPVRMIGCFDDDWPTWLTSIPDSPVLIYVRGSVPPGGSIAVVGTRNPTTFGLSVVSAVVREAAQRGTGVVSGLALGIDAAAHRAALSNGLPTWAVLGSGVDSPSPREHLELADEIVDAGGGLLSEQAPGAPPSAASLVARNRIQSAASFAVVAAQCGIPSGTLHTVRFALQQRRRLVAVRPRPPWDQEPQSAGSLAITDPSGCSPAVIGATGDLAREVSARRPLADVVLSGLDDVASIWE